MQLLPDSTLYTKIDVCLAFLRGLEEAPAPAFSGEKMPVHFYWEGLFSAKAALCLKSFFATQDLDRFSCWLWLATESEFNHADKNPHLAPFLPFIELRRFDLAQACAGTPLEAQPWLSQSEKAAARSDIARLTILHHHGGIYSDMDAFFLRSLVPLFGLTADREFIFQWSHVRRGTNAFCFLRRQSPVGIALMQQAARRQSAHPAELFDFHCDTFDLLVLPVAFFSPLWLHDDKRDRSVAAPFDRFPHFFRRFRWWFRRDSRIQHHRDFFPGAFTYHWHNLWRAREHPDSYAGVLAASVEQELGEKHPALAQLPAFGTS